MKENVLDVLMYLFQNYIYDDTDIHPDRDSVYSELLDAGFQPHEVTRAFEWLDGLAEHQEALLPASGERSFRIYTTKESNKLDVNCRGYLLFLEHAGILDPDTREIIIERIMALDSDDIDLTDLKWIILMVLFNQPGQEEAYAWMEDLLFDDIITDYLH